MRFHASISATRSTPPRISVNVPPNSDYEPEIEVSFGGLGIWLTESEADHLAKQLIDAGIRIRTDRAATESGREDHTDGSGDA